LGEAQEESLVFNNYSIKKILPRLIIVAIAVNLSFYICAAMVDISNILGANLKDFIGNIYNNPDPTKYGWAGSLGYWTAGAALATVGGIAVIILIFCNLGTVLLGFLLVLAVLALREVLVTVLIIISPIAFVLYLLPNTEKWFKKWLNEFARCLFVYPAIALVWGATELVTYIMLSSDPGQTDVMTFVMVCVVQIVPVIAIIPIMKMGGSALGKLQGAVSGGLEKTGLRKINTAARNIAKPGAQYLQRKALTGLSNKFNPGAWEKQADGSYRSQNGRVVGRIRDKGKRKGEQVGSRMLKKLQAAGEDDKALAKLSERNPLAKGLGATTGFLAGLGSGNLAKRLEMRSEEARADTKGAKKTEKLEAEIKFDPRAVQREIDKEKFELDLKGRPKNIDLEARRIVQQREAESGVKSAQFSTATRALEMAREQGLDMGAVAGVAAHRDQLQTKNTEEQVSGVINLGRIDEGEGKTSAVGSPQAALDALQHGKLLDNQGNAIKTSDGNYENLATGLASRQASTARSSDEMGSIMKQLESMTQGAKPEVQARVQSTLQQMGERQAVLLRQEQAAGQKPPSAPKSTKPDIPPGDYSI
jgi:hypothetical protein